MHRRWLAVATVVASLVTLAPRDASAQAAQRGLTLEAGFGVNGLTDDDYMNENGNGIELEPLLGLHVAALYRLVRYVSVGLLVHYGFIYPDGDDLDTQYSGFLGVTPAVRGHYAFGRIEPWLEFGIGYANAHTYAEGEWSFGPWEGEARGTVALHGVGFDLATGVTIYLNDRVGLTPFFRMILAAWPTACYRLEVDSGATHSEEDDCDDLDDIYADEPDDLPYLWVVGAAATSTF